MSHSLSFRREPAAPPTATDAERACLPINARVAALLAPVRTVPVYSDHGFEGCREVWEPGPVSPEIVPALRAQCDAIEAALVPMERGRLLGRIHALLSHYRAEPLPPAVEQAIAEDWADDLGEFPAWVVEAACRSWRRDTKRYRFRPLPGDLRRLCEELAAAAIETRRRVTRLLDGVAAVALGRAPDQGVALDPPKAGGLWKPGRLECLAGDLSGS